MYYAYTTVLLTSAFSGVIVGIFTFRHLGGYGSTKSFACVVVIAFFAIVVSIPVPFTHTLLVCACSIWFLLFFGSFLLPAMTGIMIKSVAESHRITASSLAQIGYNLFGYLPAPFLYGYISNMGDDHKYQARLAMGSLLSWSIATFIFLFFAYKTNQRRQTNNQDQKVTHI